jgi:uncharacterized protein YeaO (DUF488 family)
MAHASHDVRIKRIYEPVDPEDGTRVLVDRLWPRGVRKQTAALALWLRDIAPSPALRQWFNHDPSRWQEFRHRYRAELAGNEQAVAQLRHLVAHGRVTLLYGAHDESHNHAVVLAEYMREDNAKQPSP